MKTAVFAVVYTIIAEIERRKEYQPVAIDCVLDVRCSLNNRLAGILITGIYEPKCLFRERPSSLRPFSSMPATALAGGLAVFSSIAWSLFSSIKVIDVVPLL